MSTLVLADHDGTHLKDATLSAVTAAGQLGGEVHLLIAGAGVGGVATQAAQVAGVAKVLVADAPAYGHALAENVAPLIVAMAGAYDAILAPATTSAKNILPRVAALLDIAQVSEVTAIHSPTTFERPIYAGNAIATVETSDTPNAC